MTLILLSELLAGSLRVGVSLFLIARLLSADKPDKMVIAVSAAGGAAVAGLIFMTHMSESCQMALEVVWITVCSGRLRKADTRMRLFVAIYYEIAVFFWTFLMMAGMGILFRAPAFLERGTAGGQCAVWLLHIVLLIGTFYLLKKTDVAGKDAFRLASAVSAAGLIAVITLSEQTVLAIPEDSLSTWTILAVVLLMAVMIFNMNRQYENEKELARLKSGQAELLERDYTALNQAYAVNARLFHDFHNHIGALRQLLSHEKYAEAVRYLDELQAPVREMTDTVWTGDETADYLINSKAAAAAGYGVQMQAQVEYPRHTNIRSADLCAILGNLLDNALEAAKLVTAPEQRVVRLTIRRINQMLVIRVENSFAGAPVQENGELKTTKTDAGLHGWGLKSARTAAEKYDGMVQTACEGNQFRAVATLSFHGVEV